MDEEMMLDLFLDQYVYLVEDTDVEEAIEEDYMGDL